MVVVLGGGFTAVGHAVALLLGLASSLRLRTAVPVGARWTLSRAVLLTVGAAFGLLLLVGVALPSALVAVPAGAAAALAAFAARSRTPHRSQP